MVEITCSPEKLGRVLDEDLAEHLETQRQRLVRGMSYIQTEIVNQAPRYQGDFAASVRPYHGTPGRTWRRGGGGNDAGAAEVKGVLDEWTPGEEVGIATDAPYSRKLIFNAGDQTGKTYADPRNRRRKYRYGQAKKTYTKKVGAGWVDKIVAEGNRRMETE